MWHNPFHGKQNRIYLRDGLSISNKFIPKKTSTEWECTCFNFMARIYGVLSSFDPNSISTFCRTVKLNLEI